MGSNDTDVTLRIDGDSSGGRSAVDGLTDSLTKLGAKGQDTQAALGGVKSGADAASASATALKDTLMAAFDHPLSAVRDLSGGIANELVAALGATVIEAGLVVAAIVGVVYELGKLVEAAASVGEEIQNASYKTGIAVANIGQLKFAAEAAGGSLDQITSAIFMMENRMEQGSPQVTKGFALIGTSIASIRAMSPDQQFLAIAQGIQSIEDPAQRAAAAMDIFGRQGRELLPLMMRDIQGLVDQGNALGFAWSQTDTNAADELAIKTRILWQEFAQLQVEIGKDLMPALSLVVDHFHGIVTAIADVMTVANPLVLVFREIATAATLAKEAIDKVRGVPSAPNMNGLDPDLGPGLGNSISPFEQAQITGPQVAVSAGPAAIAIDEAATIKLLDDQLKIKEGAEAATQKITDAWMKSDAIIQKGWDDLYADQNMLGLKGLDLTLARLNKQEQDQLDAAETTIKDATQLETRKLQIELDFDAQRANATQTAEDVWVAQQVAAYDKWQVELQKTKEQVDKINIEIATGSKEAWNIGSQAVTEDLGRIKELIDDDAKAAKAAHEAHVQWMRDLNDLSSALTSLGRVSSGEFGSVINGLASIVSSFKEASKAANDFRTAQAQGDVPGEVAAGVAGVASVAQATGSGSTAQRTIGGAATGAEVGMVAGPIGAVVGGVVGGVVGFIRGSSGPTQQTLTGRATEKTFEESFGGTQGADAVTQMYAALTPIYEAQGKSVNDLRQQIDQMFADESKGAKAVTQDIAGINAVVNQQQQDQTDLTNAVQQYGFSIEELGPAMQKQQLTQQATSLANQWTLLVQSGISVGTVTQHMSGALNDYLQQAIACGQEVPQEMKPIIESMIQQGTLTDANGNKITDLASSGITFSSTMTQGFDRIVTRLDTLLQGMGLLPATFDKTTTAAGGLTNILDLVAQKAHQAADEINGIQMPNNPDTNHTSLPAFASEAYVRRPTLALIGDVAGGELVIKPSTLAKYMNAATIAGASGAMGGAHIETTVNVDASGSFFRDRASMNDLADVMVEALSDRVRSIVPLGLR